MFLHDAEYRTPSWQRRHSPVSIATHGVWRWKGMRRHQEWIEEIVLNATNVIDFGGADGPLGLGSVILDVKPPHHRTVNHLADKSVDVLFTSHCLEHLEPGPAGCALWTKVMRGGYIIVHVPAWTCERWRAGIYQNPNQDSQHQVTFKLSTEAVLPDLEAVNVDRLPLFDNTTIELAEHCGDDSIMMIARKDA